MSRQCAGPVSGRPFNIYQELLVGNIIPGVDHTVVSGQAGKLEGGRGRIYSGAVLKNGQVGLVVTHRRR